MVEIGKEAQSGSQQKIGCITLNAFSEGPKLIGHAEVEDRVGRGEEKENEENHEQHGSHVTLATLSGWRTRIGECAATSVSAGQGNDDGDVDDEDQKLRAIGIKGHIEPG